MDSALTWPFDGHIDEIVNSTDRKEVRRPMLSDRSACSYALVARGNESWA